MTVMVGDRSSAILSGYTKYWGIVNKMKGVITSYMHQTETIESSDIAPFSRMPMFRFFINDLNLS
jgi:hypothetical protein